jgi:hypothetical protein
MHEEAAYFPERQQRHLYLSHEKKPRHDVKIPENQLRFFKPRKLFGFQHALHIVPKHRRPNDFPDSSNQAQNNSYDPGTPFERSQPGHRHS